MFISLVVLCIIELKYNLSKTIYKSVKKGRVI